MQGASANRRYLLVCVLTRYAGETFTEVSHQSVGLRPPQLSNQDPYSPVRFAAFVSKAYLSYCDTPMD